MRLICRTCLLEIKSPSFTCLGPWGGSGEIKRRLQLCVPELVLDLATAELQLMCNECVQALEIAYKFKNTCINTEKYIKAYVQNLILKSSVIDLVEVGKEKYDHPLSLVTENLEQEIEHAVVVDGERETEPIRLNLSLCRLPKINNDEGTDSEQAIELAVADCEREPEPVRSNRSFPFSPPRINNNESSSLQREIERAFRADCEREMREPVPSTSSQIPQVTVLLPEPALRPSNWQLPTLRSRISCRFDPYLKVKHAKVPLVKRLKTESTHACSDCDYVASTGEDLCRHVIIFHLDATPKVTAGKTIIGVDEKPRICPVCKDVITGPSSMLSQHVQDHFDSLP